MVRMIIKVDDLAKSQKSDGTVKSSRCKARESLGMRRTYQYVAMTKDEAQRRPSALLRAVSLPNGRWTFYEAVKVDDKRFDGYDLCIPACVEGALQIAEGKASV